VHERLHFARIPRHSKPKAGTLTVTTAASWLFTIDQRVFIQDEHGEIHEASETERRDALLQLSIHLAAYSGSDT
jgi:hypothetical protein